MRRNRWFITGAWSVVVALGVLLATLPVWSQNATPQGSQPSAEDFDKLFKQYSNWNRWGPNDERGTANLITAEKVKQATSLVRLGISVSLTQNPLKESAPDNNATTFEHVMNEGLHTDTYRFAYHAAAMSHIDGLCHVAHNGMMYNGVPESSNTKEGCPKLGIDKVKNGLITRGILIDVPRLKGVPYLANATPVYAQDIEAWEKKAGVTVSPGDAVLLYTGRWAKRQAAGPFTERAGFDIFSVGPWLKKRDVGSIGTDGAGGWVPNHGQFHTFVIAGLGVNLLDNLNLEELAATAAKLNRWEFMLTIAPLPVTGGTGSPVNALATF